MSSSLKSVDAVIRIDATSGLKPARNGRYPMCNLLRLQAVPLDATKQQSREIWQFYSETEGDGHEDLATLGEVERKERSVNGATALTTKLQNWKKYCNKKNKERESARQLQGLQSATLTVGHAVETDVVISHLVDPVPPLDVKRPKYSRGIYSKLSKVVITEMETEQCASAAALTAAEPSGGTANTAVAGPTGQDASVAALTAVEPSGETANTAVGTVGPTGQDASVPALTAVEPSKGGPARSLEPNDPPFSQSWPAYHAAQDDVAVLKSPISLGISMYLDKGVVFRVDTTKQSREIWQFYPETEGDGHEDLASIGEVQRMERSVAEAKALAGKLQSWKTNDFIKKRKARSDSNARRLHGLQSATLTDDDYGHAEETDV
ncbi:hypothetical protein CEUSTIGMA_g13427.t1 [Chlamydomonas eustigma]|uniref:Uncharacterized protein n=1 Tax=Chlamydomonas eustigma TaxID=1157962 RepID=A0A250XSE7_9CHLO|nr:hypothetical protein CEUSTIGMA_g13427.t1 [Chlamydomonas eustigma]|eukprot:GAX86011.1 hypothetical protein CEUSTIGMA_g13427.t1 [Chlamydomonas eustigma]